MGQKAEDMRQLIQAWLDEKAGRDITLLSRRTGLEYNTVRRVYNGSNPDCQTALALLTAIAPKEAALAYLRQHFPFAAAFHEKELTTESFYSDAEQLRPFIENQMTFVIMNLAYGGHATRSTILKGFGEYGLEAAESLVAANKLQWSAERLEPLGEERFFSYDTKNDLVNACRHIVNLSQSEKGFPVAFVGSLSDDEVSTAKAIVRESCGALKELFLNSKGGKNMIALTTVFVSLFEGKNEKNNCFNATFVSPESFCGR